MADDPVSVTRHPAFRLVLLCLVLGLSYFKWLPFPWRQPAVAVIAVSLVLMSGESLADVGFRRARFWATIGWALVAVVLTCGVITPFVEPFLNRMTGTPADYSGYGELTGNLPAALQLIAFAWLSAAIGEEIIFRGFLLHETGAVFGTGRTAAAGSVILGSVLFGLSHNAQGLVGMILTGLAGLLTGVIFLASNRNIWSIILAHGLIDVWGVLTLYYGWY
jgi:membrane protease YdiL (CAAX protease family)